MISLFAAALALTAPSQGPTAATEAAAPSPVTDTARRFLELVDARNWRASWDATARSFRTMNTVDAWTAASQQARVPLGAVVSRTLLAEQDVPAGPNGLKLVRFRTDFANRQGATETLSLDREDGGWKVVGIYIE